MHTYFVLKHSAKTTNTKITSLYLAETTNTNIPRFVKKKRLNLLRQKLRIHDKLNQLILKICVLLKTAPNQLRQRLHVLEKKSSQTKLMHNKMRPFRKETILTDKEFVILH